MELKHSCKIIKDKGFFLKISFQPNRTKEMRDCLLQDYQFGDIDYMDQNLDFTYSKDRWAGLPTYVNQLKDNGTKFIIILDPAIANGIPNYRPFDLGQQMDVWVKNADNKTPVEGKV
jgi:alpha-glucosidase (family GH31 glycosyl hydrolase)